MNKLLLSALATMAMGSSSLLAENAGLYIGAGYASTAIDFSAASGLLDLPAVDTATDSLVFLAGIDFNEYFGIEGRYYWNITSTVVDSAYNVVGIFDDYKAESFALYAKPQYSLDIVSLYALLGVTMNDYSALTQSNSDTLFSWGGGAKLNFTESFSIFVDYTDLGESDTVLTTGLSSWNIGLSFKF